MVDVIVRPTTGGNVAGFFPPGFGRTLSCVLQEKTRTEGVCSALFW